MSKRDLPDIYTLARGPQARGRGHIYRVTNTFVKLYTVQHKTLAGENFGRFPVIRQSFIHQILDFSRLLTGFS